MSKQVEANAWSANSFANDLEGADRVSICLPRDWTQLLLVLGRGTATHKPRSARSATALSARQPCTPYANSVSPDGKLAIGHEARQGGPRLQFGMWLLSLAGGPSANQLILAHTPLRAVALPVDSVLGVLERSDGEITSSTDFVPGTAHFDGVAKLDDGLLFIHDIMR